MPRKADENPTEEPKAPDLDVKALVAEMRSTVQALEQERNELAGRLKAAEEQNRADALAAPAREKLEESVPIDALEQFMEAKFVEIAKETLKTELAPLFKASAANAAIDPELLTEAQKALRANPELNRKFTAIANADPDAAGEYLNAMIRASRPPSVVAPEKKREAAIIRGAESEPDGGAEATQNLAARKEALLKYAQRSKDDKTVATELFRGLRVWRPGSDRIEEVE